MKKIISFDLDGTLINSSYADLVWLKGLPTIFAKEKEISFEHAQEYLLKEYNAIGDERVEWYDIDFWFKKYKLHYSWKQLLDDYKNAIEPYPEVPEVLKRLSKNYTLILSSNAKREFIDIEVTESTIKPYFSHIFSSISDFHQVKKETKFYRKICNTLRIDRHELIHIGDNKTFDYVLPKKIGIQSFYLDRNRKNKEENSVSNLKEFEDKLKELCIF
jgi:putative hydrolase of the HAD superfamily